ncbi:Urb2/Npa2 family-domain-containing protein [Coprinopsis sp. MPI-PUGE-AT-0042]|nr:Urb2/Npa2 family-domain-containing protein [Coprinopsis sp. MPI-PUGE-AT-0042]
MNGLQSSQNFVRTLKSPNDPPVPGGPLKIALAEQAWEDTTFRVPNKEEVIVDWLLAKWSKEKPSNLKEAAVIDSRYWKLLNNILPSPGTSSASWLKALLGRIAVVPVMTSLLEALNAARDSEQLLSLVAPCLAIIWPIGTQKVTTEVFLSCWTTFLVKSLHLRDNADLDKIGTLITESYRASFANSSTRKKVHTTFVQNIDHFKSWLEHISTASSPTTHSLLPAGVETLFNVDILRSIQDSKDPSSEIPLFQSLSTLSKSHRRATLDSLPKLFEHYLAALRKHKSTIFSGSSGPHQLKPDINSAALQFFAFAQNLLDSEDRDSHAWTVACRLLQAVEDEHLQFTRDDTSGSVLLAKNLDLGLIGLQECYLEENGQLTRIIVDCMSALVRIDCDLVLPSTLRILARLLCVPASSSQHFAFLGLLLEYHIKTRTLDEYVERLFSVSSTTSSSTTTPLRLPFTAQSCYALHLSSPLMHHTHLERLARAIQQFVTPTQCGTLVASTIQVLNEIQGRYKSAQKGSEEDGSRKKKKRKSEAAMDQQEVAQGDADDIELLAVRYASTARIAQVVLGSVPLHSLPSEQAEKVRSSASQFLADFVQHHTGKLVKSVLKKSEGSEQHADAGDVSTKKKRKQRSGEAVEEGWASQIILCALLKLQYALERATGLALPLNVGEEEAKSTKRIVGLLKLQQHVLPELVLELSRHLLLHCTQMDPSVVPAIFEPILMHIEAGNASSEDMGWSGQPHELSSSSARPSTLSLALLHLVLERWLPTIDALASSEQLSRLVATIAHLPLLGSLVYQAQDQTGQLLPHHLLLRTLRSAQFWELGNLRTALTDYLLVTTKAMETSPSDAPSATASKKKSKSKSCSSSLESTTTATFQLLLFFPVECFTKACRADLVKRALAADRRLHPCDTEEKAQALGVLRTFLERTFRFTGMVEQQSPGEMADFLLHVLQEPRVEVGHSYLKSTLDLASLYFLEIFRQCPKSTSGEIPKILSPYTQHALCDGSHLVRSESLLRLVELVAREFQFTNFAEDSQNAFKGLHSHLGSTLKDLMESVLAADGAASTPNPPLLSGWHAVLTLGSWIGVKESHNLYGHRLARTLTTKSGDSAEGVSVMTVAIVLQELQYRDPTSHSEQLDLAMATYLARFRGLSSQGRAKLDDQVGQASRSLTPASYGHILDFIAEALAQAALPPNALSDAIHLGMVVLKENPNNTLKLTQDFVTTCINTFNANAVYLQGPLELRLRVLGLLSQHCSGRPAALRLLDMGGLWLLLSKFLSPCHEHDTTTSSDIFIKIVYTANSLIRLRRDLVVSMLPHVGMVLRQLLMTMRRCRPQLGTRQTEMVMDTLPRWVSADKALGVEEAKALARLLETLTTKSVPRNHHAANNPTEKEIKAESLAAAFSKHASYVLKAYIEALNEPLCIIGVDVRKELASGIHALCGMINEHSRDSLMASALDSSGKAMMKALWKEYEKQRYVGKG